MKMNTSDNNNVYKVLCTKLLLQYLNSKDKKEFSSSCKFIYQKCTKFRLSVYESNFSEFIEYVDIIKKKLNSTEQTDNNELDYINNIITEYKPHLKSLVCLENPNYYILKYFSMDLDSLVSFHLSKLCIPMITFKKIVKNLPNLQVLVLSNIGIALKENGHTSTKFKFPKHLTKLTITTCYQFNCDSISPASMGKVNNNYRNGRNLDISNFKINTLKYLNWFSGYKESADSLNELLANNDRLETLEVHLGRLNAISLSIISNNRNLTNLIIFSLRYLLLKYSSFPKLRYIKSLELKSVVISGYESVNRLFENCPNLEEIKYNMMWGNELGLHVNLYRFKKLKKLSIIHNDIVFLLSVPFPDSPVEHLEFTSRTPFRVGFSLFNNLKYLKRITITGLTPNSMNHDYTNQMLDSNHKWTEIKYSDSVQFWKIIENKDQCLIL
jgi:hypothetical protein